MSLYAQPLAQARLEALRASIDALQNADSPAEKRRCATALLKAPKPCEIDDALEPTNPNTPHQRAPSVSERDNTLAPGPTTNIKYPTSDIPTASPEDLALISSLMLADDATVNRTLTAQPRLMSLLTPANLAAARELNLAPT